MQTDRLDLGMSISVDNALKKKVRIENRRRRKGIHNLWIFEKGLLDVVLILIFAFPIYCVATGNFISTNTRTGEHSYFVVAFLTSIFGGMGLTLVLLVSVIRKRIENVAIGERVDETIEILGDKLFYSFRIKYQTLSNQRNLVILDLRKIKNVSYDEMMFKINVEGVMVEKIVDMSFDGYQVEESEMTNSKLTMWDYFNPSLYELLKSKAK